MTTNRARARSDRFAVRLRPAVRRILALVLLSLFVGSVAAQARPGWVVQDDVASVEPFAAPSQIVASDASLVVACDPDAPGGLNVAMFVGRYAVPLPPELDVLVRIDREEPRRAAWLTNEDTLALPAYFDEVGAILDDLRSGATFAARLFLFAGVDDAAQPTFQFDVTGFAGIERQLACGTGGTASDDPFAEAPAPPATPAAPGSEPPVTPWTVTGSGRETTAMAVGDVATLVATCEYESQIPIGLVLVDGGPAAGRAFSLRLADGDVLDLVDLGEGLYQIVPAGVPALGGTGLLVAGAAADAFDVRVVFADGSQFTLLRAEGGDGFFDAWDALPCTRSESAEPAASTPTTSGSWRLELDGGAVSYRDPQGRGLGFLCSPTEEGVQPVVYLELPGVPISVDADGLVDFAFSRASGVGGSATWTFADAGDGFYVTDLVATGDIGVKLLPNEGSDAWNTVTVAVPGGSGPVLSVRGEQRFADLYGQLTCFR